MHLTRRSFGLGLLLGASQFTPVRANWDTILSDDIEGLENIGPAIEAYIYGYPLVTMEMTRRVMTNVAAPEGTRAPMGQLMRARHYPSASFRDVPAPNADTLYTTAWLDVGKEPWVLGIPDMKGRYFMFPMLDAWTNVFQAPGSRTTGTGPQAYAITGPSWTGTLPEGVKQVQSPTNLVWILGRIYCTGTPEDYAAVHALQDACQLVPLHAYGKPYSPEPGHIDASVDMETPVRTQVKRLDAASFFALLAELLSANPPAAADEPMLPTLAQLGIVPGKPFEPAGFDLDFARLVPKVAFDRILLHFKFSDGDIKSANGWRYTLRTGAYGTDYLQRALIAAVGLGANLPLDAVYPMSRQDGNGQSYSGTNQYILRFAKGATPPAKAFWSLTMYDEHQFFVPNPLDRYSISPRPNLRANADGSIDIYIQTASPGADKESNWLPAPTGKFNLMLRLYWPDTTDPSLLDGSWLPPPVMVQG